MNRETAKAAITLIGRLATLIWEPPTIQIETAGRMRHLLLSVSLRDDARRLWGEQVLIQARAALDAKAQLVGQPRVVSLSLA